MAKVKVINNNLDSNINGDAFQNTTSQTIFKFGSFSITSNFDGRTFIDYTKTLSSFVNPVTLTTLGLTDSESNLNIFNSNNAILNLDKTNLNTYVKFGSAYEFFRYSIQDIILNYPGSLFVSSTIENGGNVTFINYIYDQYSNTSTFQIPSQYTVNIFGLAFNYGNSSQPNNNKLNNINLSYTDYVIWSNKLPTDNSFSIIGFTGDSSYNPYISIKCNGNPFSFVSGSSTGYVDFHIKPNNRIFDNYRNNLENFETYILSNRVNYKGFQFIVKEPVLMENGDIVYNNRKITWPTTDGYNINISGTLYDNFLSILLAIGNKYDQVKTDLIARFLTPASIKTYDLTSEGKILKLLKIYGQEFDELKKFIDSIAFINKVTYDKKNNLPDQIIGNLAKTLGWNHFQLVNELQFVETIFNNTGAERNLLSDLTPAEIDIELWRRILINTNYFWKSKGTRDAIKAIFQMIGIPEQFINITEYVYTVDGKINPNTVNLSLSDLPSASLPYDVNGYPIAPQETTDFYFQMSGNTDSGQAYMNNFRNVGFDLSLQIDNKKSWIEEGAVYRNHYSSPTYFQEDSSLVLNTKEVDITLDAEQGVEYDVFNYISTVDYPSNSSGYTLPYSYINVSLGYTGTENTFTLPTEFNNAQGDIEVRYNGILLNSPQEYSGGTTPYEELMKADYTVSNNTITLTNNNYASNYGGTNRDIIDITYIYTGSTTPLTGVSVSYVVTRVIPQLPYTYIDLPSGVSGDVQLTINGIAATQGSNDFVADYIIDPNNSSRIIIQNPDLISYFAQTDLYTQVAFISVSGTSSVYSRNETIRVDSFNSENLYFNGIANKVVMKLKYRISDANHIKVLINGIGIEPNTDYIINPNNNYELFLPNGITYGTIISVYYMVSDSINFNPLVADSFGIGDISTMSFLEFIDSIQSKMINARNRKTITDFRGGWYPSLLNLYVNYLHRSYLDSLDPFKTNGYTFSNLYAFLNKYNAFFQQFVDQLLSPTIIQRKGGLLIRNSIFTKQKFAYKRGVSFDTLLNYFGDDGSVFIKKPYTQLSNWTSDYVCLTNVDCRNLAISGVTVAYDVIPPVTGNTGATFTANIYIVESFSYNDTTQSTTEYTLDFNPNIPSSGTYVSVNLGFESVFDNQDEAGVGMDSIITIKRDNIIIKEFNLSETSFGFNTVINNYNLVVKDGDLITISLTNDITLSGSNKYISSKTIFSPDILTITPAGNIGTVLPQEVINEINGGVI